MGESREPNQYAITLDELEASVHIPVSEQTIVQPVAESVDPTPDWNNDQNQLRLAGGA